MVKVRKLDGPPNRIELVAGDKLIKLSEEQERIIPEGIAESIRLQREIVFSERKTPSLSKKRRPKSIADLKEVLKKSSFEEIMMLLAESQMEMDQEKGETDDPSEEGSLLS